MRPQRGSREMSIIGAKVHCIPTELASIAAIRAPYSTVIGLKVAACPNGIGKIVLNP